MALPAWEMIMATVIMITFLIVTLFYVVAGAFNLRNLMMWAKGEYVQLAISVLIVGAMLVAASIASDICITISREIMTNMGVPVPANLDQFAMAKLEIMTMNNCMANLYSDIYHVLQLIEPIEKKFDDIGGQEGTGGWPLSGPVSMMKIIANYLIFTILMNYLQLNFLEIARQTMLSLFLPAGLILRTFPMTRGAGGFLIAIAIAGFFVLPVSYMLTMAMFGNIRSDCNVKLPDELKNAPVFCYTTHSDMAYQKNWVSKIIGIGALDDWLQKLNNNWIRRLQGLFLPIVSLTITFTFVRATSTIFGADVMEFSSGLVKVI